MASACLPLLFHAVEIDGEAYWDGGYSGNPTLLPFLRATATEDVLIVQINPRERRRRPDRRARDHGARAGDRLQRAAAGGAARARTRRRADRGGSAAARHRVGAYRRCGCIAS